MLDYRTVLKKATAETVEKKSRFIAHVSPVTHESEAIAMINDVRTAYRDASHNVYAYLCRENNAGRYSDDGEPSATAGIPVLDIIKKEGLTDICVVVTRYFGGTLLGTGGLVRAYGGTAKEGIIAAEPTVMVYSDIFSVKCDYSLLGKIQYEIAESDCILLDTVFESDVTLTACTAAKNSEALVKRLTEASFGKAEIKKTGTRYVPAEKRS